MKKISEMTLEELQDHALDLESKLTAADTEKTTLNDKITELTGLNLDLQKRNNSLLMKVEQQYTPTSTPTPEPVHIETCEEFAARIAKGE